MGFQTCFATGWGKDQFGAAGNYQVVLKEIDLPVVGHDQCEASLRTTRLASLLGVSDVVRTTLLVSTPLCPRVSAGSTTPRPASLVSGPAPTPATGATQLSSARPG